MLRPMFLLWALCAQANTWAHHAKFHCAQREEARKEEKQLRELADKKTEESKNEGKRGRYLVVGQRGRRRIVWTDRVD